MMILKKGKKIYKNVGPVHTYLDVFESTTFSWRIWLLSSWRCIQHTSFQPFWILSSEWKFFSTLWIQNLVDTKCGYLFIQWCKKIRLSSLTQEYFRCHWAQCYPFSTSWTSQASFDVRQKLNEWTSSWWDNFVCVTVIEEEWQENSCMSQTSLYRLADELRVNLDKLDLNTLHVDMEIFESAKTILWIQKYPVMCGWNPI